MDIDEERQLRHELAELRLEHRALDTAIGHLSTTSAMEQMELRRLKKRKLQLKDLIARLESRIIPDLLA